MTRTPASESALLRPMLPYLRQTTGLLAIGSIAGIAMNTAVVLPAILLGHAVDTLLAVHAGTADRTDLIRAVTLLIAGTLATELPRIGKRYWLGVARSRIRATVRADAVRGVLAWPPERLHQTAPGDVIARIIGDVEVLGTGIGEIIVETWDTLLFSAALATAMYFIDPQLALLSLAPVPAALILAKAAGRQVAQRTLTARAANAELTGYIAEHLTAVRLLHVAGRRTEATTGLRRKASAQADAEIATARLAALLQPVYGTLTTAGVVAVIWYGGARVASAAMSVGALVAFLQLFLRFAGRAWRIPQMANRVQAAAAAYQRLQPLLAPPVRHRDLPAKGAWRSVAIPSPRSAPAAATDRRTGGANVRLREVTFAYPGTSEPALRSITFDVPAGTLLAVTGPVGSGKTALAQLIAGLCRPDSGTVLVGGRPPHAWTDADRTAVGYLPQDHPVFTGTLVTNILLRSPDPAAGEPRLDAAVALSRLTTDLDTMADGLDTAIGERGVRISGGQRQRIGLARSIAAPRHAPRLLVLDDPFSAVDVETEAAIIAELRAYCGPQAPPDQQATIVLCSTRLAAFPQADHIIVLDHGTICERGRHEDLLAADDTYARIYRAQQRIRR